jgi:hypothetical protein
MNNEKKILEKKVSFLEQKISEIEECYPRSSDQMNLLMCEIDRHRAQLLRLEIQEEYDSIENEVD